MFKACDVKELREKTGAGMLDCKKALEATEGDMEKAVGRRGIRCDIGCPFIYLLAFQTIGIGDCRRRT